MQLDELLQKRITLTVQEVSDFTGLPRGNIYKAIERGELETRKIGKRVLILTSSFKKWMGLN